MRSKGFQINISTLSAGVSFKLLQKDVSHEFRSHWFIHSFRICCCQSSFLSKRCWASLRPQHWAALCSVNKEKALGWISVQSEQEGCLHAQREQSACLSVRWQAWTICYWVLWGFFFPLFFHEKPKNSSMRYLDTPPQDATRELIPNWLREAKIPSDWGTIGIWVRHVLWLKWEEEKILPLNVFIWACTLSENSWRLILFNQNKTCCGKPQKF